MSHWHVTLGPWLSKLNPIPHLIPFHHSLAPPLPSRARSSSIPLSGGGVGGVGGDGVGARLDLDGNPIAPLTIYMIGARGFIGFHLCEKLMSETAHTVLAVDVYNDKIKHLFENPTDKPHPWSGCISFHRLNIKHNPCLEGLIKISDLVEGESIRNSGLINRRKEKVNRKYSQPVTKRRQLSPGFLDDALDEEEEQEDYNSSRRPQARRRFEEDLEAEAQAEKRILNAKMAQVNKNAPRKLSLTHPSKHSIDEYESEREESEYETDGEDVERNTREDDANHEDEYDEEEVDAEPEDSASEEEEPRRRSKETGGRSLKRKEIESDEDSPPIKPINRRKAVVFDSDED